MRRELLMPKLGLTMTEGALVEWMVSSGARFKAGDGLFVVETDKVANEVPAEFDGTLLEIVVPAGETVEVGRSLGYVDDGGAEGAVGLSGLDAAAGEPQSLLPPDAHEPGPRSAEAADAGRVVATPFARRLAEQFDVTLDGVTGNGPGGRIRAADVRDAADTWGRFSESKAQAPAQVAATATAGAADGSTSRKPSATQSTIARRLTQVKQQVPHFYLAAEAEVTALEVMRAELNRSGVNSKISLTNLLVAATGRALHALPEFNRVWTDEAIVSFDTCDVGIAVDSPKGLLVPVVRDVGKQTLRDTASATQALVAKAREGSLTAEDMAGGSVSISNAGMFGVTWITPIINPGQSMILGVGSVRELFRPDAERRPSLRREMGLVLAADHRIFNGVSGLRFLNAVIDGLQNPASLVG